MKSIATAGIVAGGYVAAIFLASAAVAVRVASTSGPDAQASSGMYAFGDAVLFVAVFGVVVLIPTGVGLFALRPYHRFWKVLAATSTIIALTGVAAVALFIAGRHDAGASLGAWASVSVLRILAAPLFAAAFMLFALMSPHRSLRLTLLGAVAIEVAVTAYGGLVWFVPMLFGGSA